ncbi:phage-related baseplate assembly protein [Paraburkholderia sp. EB58]|uniref:baseplate J/gp47 family protein n=1 Tax=Paraburkholderia sp. EB58 TaxID=3035125 RepID=UPI003D207811
MAAISWQGFTDFVADNVAAVQAAATSIIDATTGSITLAFAQAVSGVALWLQAYIIQVLLLTRAATSNNTDLDSFVGDFGMTRIAAKFSVQTATFASFSYTTQRLVTPGQLISTGPGGIQFMVTLDATNTAWNATLQAYVVPAGTQSVTVPIQAVVAGTSGNVLSGTVTSFVVPIVGIDTVTNFAPSPQTGYNAESDPALRLRFVAFFATLSKATKTAIGLAIMSVQNGITYSLVENQTYAGASQPGYFYAVVDDGSGDPSSSLISAEYAAIDAVRPICSTFNVYGPNVVRAAVSATLITGPTYTHSLVVAAAVTALTNFLNTIPEGTGLPYGQIYSLLFSVPGVTNVTLLLLNGGTSDLTVTAQQVVKAGTISLL